MVSCMLCKTRHEKGSGLTFHRFPTDSTKQLWLKNLKIDSKNLKATARLCSKHFTDDCFINHMSRVSLKRGSVPTIFLDNPSLTSDTPTSAPPCASTTTIGIKRELDNLDDSTSGSTIKPKTANKPCQPIKIDHHYENTPPRTVIEVAENVEHDHSYKDIPPRAITLTKVVRNMKDDHHYQNAPRSSKKMLQHLKKSLASSRGPVILPRHVRRFPTDSTKQLWLKKMKTDSTNLEANDPPCSKNFSDDCFTDDINSRESLERDSSTTIFLDNPSLTSDTPTSAPPCASTTTIGIKRELDNFDDTMIDPLSTTTTMIDPLSTITTTDPLSTIMTTMDPLSTIKPKTANKLCQTPDHYYEYTPRTIIEIARNVNHDHSYGNTPFRTTIDNMTDDHHYQNELRTTKKMLQHLKKSLALSRARGKVLSQHVKRLKNNVSYLKTVIKELKKNNVNDGDYVYVLSK